MRFKHLDQESVKEVGEWMDKNLKKSEDNIAGIMTKELALFVYNLRKSGNTWRRISKKVESKGYDVISGNQSDGEMLCRRAREFLGEDWGLSYA